MFRSVCTYHAWNFTRNTGYTSVYHPVQDTCRDKKQFGRLDNQNYSSSLLSPSFGATQRRCNACLTRSSIFGIQAKRENKANDQCRQAAELALGDEGLYGSVHERLFNHRTQTTSTRSNRVQLHEGRRDFPTFCFDPGFVCGPTPSRPGPVDNIRVRPNLEGPHHHLTNTAFTRLRSQSVPPASTSVQVAVAAGVGDRTCPCLARKIRFVCAATAGSTNPEPPLGVLMCPIPSSSNRA